MERQEERSKAPQRRSTRWIDIGVNLDHRRFQSDRDAVVARARDGAIDCLLTGTSLAGSERAADLAVRYGWWSTAGIHPHDAAAFAALPEAASQAALRALLTRPEVVAVGECGLDFDRDFSPRDVQREVFETQIALAKEYAMPLFLHERAAPEDMLALMDAHGIGTELPGVVHCFTGEKATLERYLERGLCIGITGWVCDERRGLDLQKLVPQIPKGRLMLETDDPFLTPRTIRPRPKKGRNEPVFLRYVAELVASLRGESVEELRAHTTACAESLFGGLAARPAASSNE